MAGPYKKLCLRMREIKPSTQLTEDFKYIYKLRNDEKYQDSIKQYFGGQGCRGYSCQSPEG